MDGHQGACIVTATKIATVIITRNEKIPAAQKLRCAHIRSVARVWRKSVARSIGDLSSSQVGGGVMGMNKMGIERYQKGGKTKPHLNKNFARRKGLSSSQGPKCSEYEGRGASSSSEIRFPNGGYS